MTTPKQAGWCSKCGASFSTIRGFKKHIREYRDEMVEDIIDLCRNFFVYRKGLNSKTGYKRLKKSIDLRITKDKGRYG